MSQLRTLSRRVTPWIFAKVPTLLLVLEIALFQALRKIHDQIGKDRTKYRFVNDSFTGFESLRFVTTVQQSSRRSSWTAFALPIRVSIFLNILPSFVNTTHRYLYISTSCSVLPLSCSVHCLGFLKRYKTSFFLLLLLWTIRSFYCWFSFLLCRTQLKTHQAHVEDPVQNMLTAPDCVQKANAWPCCLQKWPLSTRRLQSTNHYHQNITLKSHFRVASKKNLCEMKLAGKIAQKLFWQVWENSDKNPSHPPKNVVCL